MFPVLWYVYNSRMRVILENIQRSVAIQWQHLSGKFGKSLLAQTCLPMIFLYLRLKHRSQIIAIYSNVTPFTLRIPLAIIVCYSHTFEINLVIKQMFTKYLKESRCIAADQHFSFKFFPQNSFVSKIFPKSSGFFWPP